jgi:hypothetical protein
MVVLVDIRAAKVAIRPRVGEWRLDLCCKKWSVLETRSHPKQLHCRYA